jgi:hypothetical protein
MTPVRLFCFAADGDPDAGPASWPERVGDELEFHRFEVPAGDDRATVLVETVRHRIDGQPFAVFGHGRTIATALATAHALLPDDRAMHIFLSGTGHTSTTDATGDAGVTGGPGAAGDAGATGDAGLPPPVPVTYFAAAGTGLPDRLGRWPVSTFPTLTVRLLPGPDGPSSAVADVILLGIREELGTWDPGGHVWTEPEMGFS